MVRKAVASFVVLGFAVTLIMGATGVRDLSTNIGANIFVAVVFMALAFSLFGAYEIQIPPVLLNKLNKKADSGEGVISVQLSEKRSPGPVELSLCWSSAAAAAGSLLAGGHP